MGDLVKKNWLSLLKNTRFVKNIQSRASSFYLTDDLVVRLRIVLFLTSLLAFFLAFEMGDDWYVREFANYDWARHIGY